MNRLILFCFITIGFLGSAQYADQDNRFNKANVEQQAPNTDATANAGGNGEDDGENPGNAGDAPIDDYIPGLMLLGIGLVAYYGYRQQQLKS
ncbi:hypothetical protein SAMN05660477_01563 [Soonwooa buanensis]|uniref:PEP-CTERM protein-sorting domain-containing protein n=1 Tax=Soonwooa buanensis TaxID=619805 RepID=A0A1T5EU08_9FLAO|nr:hypothetical protein [Soonwooa buanensis]SKB87422.1 hypothetical protein SAMN05660477_01563 [Soonwooa buanensis]